MVSTIFLAGLLLGSPLALAAGVTDLSLTQARKTASGRTHDALAAKSSALIQARDAAGLAAHIAELKNDTSLAPPSREQLLHDTVMGMADIEPDATARAEIRALRAYKSVTRVASDEHGHRELYLLHDVAAAASFAERRWEENDARHSATTTIANGDPDLLDHYVAGSQATRRGIELAIAGSPAQMLTNYQMPILTGLRGGQPIAQLARVTAVRAADPTLLLAVLEEAPPPVALQALREMRLDHWPGAAMGLLEAAATRAETASAAMLRLGALIATEPLARQFLFDSMGGPHGASAVAALARTGADDTIDELAHRLMTADDELVRRQALLGLRLADTVRARSHLSAFAAVPDAPAHLVAEVPSWLRD